MADALGSGPSGSNPLEVQVLSSVLRIFLGLLPEVFPKS